MSNFKELIELGFTPAAALAITACGALWIRTEILYRRNEKTREDWHAATLARVDQMDAHVKECNDDREKIKAEASELKAIVATLTERNKRFSNCPRKLCPMRLP